MAFGALTVVMLILAAASFLIWRSHVHREFRQAHYVVGQMVRLSTVMRNYGETYGSLPGPTFDKAVRDSKAYAQREGVGDSIDWTLFLKGRDVWDHLFSYEWREEGKVMQLRSSGPNGRDEQGHHDDLVVDVDIRKF
jgi:hypothetical protein